MARPGTENHGTEKYWHGTARKILARKNIGTAWHEKSDPFLMGETYFQEFGPIFMGEKYFQEFGPIFMGEKYFQGFGTNSYG